jgi:hypothetical protein
VARSRHSTLAVALSILVLALAGCGGSKQPATTTITSPASAQAGNYLVGAATLAPDDLSRQ